MKNYFEFETQKVNKNSYFQEQEVYFVPYSYTIKIEDSLDIFSKLPGNLFSNSIDNQISNTLKCFKEQYISYISKRDLTTVLPKLQYLKDEDGASVIQMASSWDLGNAMVYLAFETDEKESSFGMVWNDKKKKDYMTRSGNISLNNLENVINEIIEFIFKVY